MTTSEYYCLYCNKLLEAYKGKGRPNIKYCPATIVNGNCKQRHADQLKSEVRAAGRVDMVCVVCGEKFTPSKVDAQTCTPQCSNKLQASKRTPELQREYNLHRHGLTSVVFKSMLEEQNNCCASCGIDDPGIKGVWYVDHDHTCCPSSGSCGKCVRGLLCHNCNSMLGYAKDDPERLAGGLKYLQKWAKKKQRGEVPE